MKQLLQLLITSIFLTYHIRYIATVFFLSAFTLLQGADKEIINQQQMWYEFTETVKVHPRWSVLINVSERHSYKPLFQTQAVARIYFLHHFKSSWSVGTGYAQFFTWSGKLAVPEFRPEQWVFYRQSFEKIKILTLIHRYKMEERFVRNSQGEKLVPGYIFIMRFRYRIGAEVVLFTTGKNKNPFKFSLSEEVMLNAGKSIVYNVFDQNRFTTGFAYRPVNGLTFSLNYMHFFRQRRTGNQFDRIHTLRIGIEHEITVKQKQKPVKI